MKIKYIKPTVTNLIDFVIFAIGAVIVLQQDSNMDLLVGVILLIAGRDGEIGKISGEINLKKEK